MCSVPYLYWWFPLLSRSFLIFYNSLCHPLESRIMLFEYYLVKSYLWYILKCFPFFPSCSFRVWDLWSIWNEFCVPLSPFDIFSQHHLSKRLSPTSMYIFDTLAKDWVALTMCWFLSHLFCSRWSSHLFVRVPNCFMRFFSIYVCQELSHIVLDFIVRLSGFGFRVILASWEELAVVPARFCFTKRSEDHWH